MCVINFLLFSHLWSNISILILWFWSYRPYVCDGALGEVNCSIDSHICFLISRYLSSSIDYEFMTCELKALRYSCALCSISYWSKLKVVRTGYKESFCCLVLISFNICISWIKTNARPVNWFPKPKITAFICVTDRMFKGSKQWNRNRCTRKQRI